MVQVQSKGTSQPQTKIWNQMFVSIFVANIALNFGQQMSNSLLAKYADSMGAPASQIGMLMSMFAVTALALRFVAGPAMDTYNRKYLVMGAMGVMTLAYFGFSFSKSISALMVFRLVQGCGNAFANVACLAMVSDALPIDKFGTGMGYYSLAQVIAQAIAPTVGLILADHIGYSRAYVIIGMVMIVAILIASRIKLHFVRTRKFRITLNNIIAKEAVFPGAILLLMMMGFQTINSFLIVFASKQGISSNIGLFFTVYALTLLISRPLIGELTDRYGLFKVAIPAMCLAGISFLIISSATSIGMFLLAAIINALGIGACQPSIQSLGIKAVPIDRRGSGSSTNYIGMDIGTIIGPTLAGVLAQNYGYAVMWQLQIIPFAIAIILVIAFKTHISNIEKRFLQQS